MDRRRDAPRPRRPVLPARRTAITDGLHATAGLDEAVRIGAAGFDGVDLGERTLVVGIDASGANRVPAAEPRAPLEYRERQEPAYVTEYDAEFALRPNVSDPA